MAGQKGQKLYEEAKQKIPGGVQLLSKRPEMFLPGLWSCYYKEAKGCEVWDLDGEHFWDMTHNGVGACPLGYSDPDVNGAVIAAIQKGTMATLNCPEEVALTEKLTSIHPWSQMARYCRSGGEAMAIAVRIARAYSKREKVAFCGYHGWHDWYLSANLSSGESLDEHLLPGLDPSGVSASLRGTTFPFRYNNIDELQSIVHEKGDELAAIVIEPIRNEYPEDGFLEEVREIASRIGAVLIFDECSSGFRLCSGGAHLKLGVEPDIAMFAKGISNGFAMAAVIGRKEIMTAAEDSFISSTYWTERIGPVAALATIEKYEKEQVHLHMAKIGEAVQKGWKKISDETGIPLVVGGLKAFSGFSVNVPWALAAKTLITQEMLFRGYLEGNALYATLAHTEEIVADYLSVLGEVLAELATPIMNGDCEKLLKSSICHSGFKRLVN